MRSNLRLGEDRELSQVIQRANGIWVKASLPPTLAVVRHCLRRVANDFTHRRELSLRNDVRRVVLRFFESPQVFEMGTAGLPCHERQEKAAICQTDHHSAPESVPWSRSKGESYPRQDHAATPLSEPSEVIAAP